MIYEKIKHTDLLSLQQFSNVYGFPENGALLRMFRDVNGGAPIGFFVGYYGEKSVFQIVQVEQLLLFDVGGMDELSASAIIETFYWEGSGIIPVAVCENGEYICYCGKAQENVMQVFDPETEEFHTLYTEEQDVYSADLFFDELKP